MKITNPFLIELVSLIDHEEQHCALDNVSPRVSLHSPGCPQTYDFLASALRVLGLQMCTTLPVKFRKMRNVRLQRWLSG